MFDFWTEVSRGAEWNFYHTLYFYPLTKMDDAITIAWDDAWQHREWFWRYPNRLKRKKGGGSEDIVKSHIGIRRTIKEALAGNIDWNYCEKCKKRSCPALYGSLASFLQDHWSKIGDLKPDERIHIPTPEALSIAAGWVRKYYESIETGDGNVMFAAEV